MKKTEIAMIVLIAGLGMAVTFFVLNNVLGDTAKRQKNVPQVDAISSDDKTPSKLIFNGDAINPTVEVLIDRDIKGDQNSVDNDSDNLDNTSSDPFGAQDNNNN